MGIHRQKQRHTTIDDDPTLGDVWTFCAIDAETKLVPAHKVGKRDRVATDIFIRDIAARVKGRVQISTDGLRTYADSIERVYGADVDYAQIIKTYSNDTSHQSERKYSTARIESSEKIHITGKPNMDLVSTSYVERLNATTRLHIKRLNRLTLAFSKKLENFEAAVALHFAYYNFVRRHNTIRCTPAMAAGVEPSFWTVGDLVEQAI